MKYRFLILLFALLSAISLSVYAATYEYFISEKDDFVSVEYGDDLTSVAEKLNMTTHDLNTYFTQNGLLYLAVSKDNKTQIKISAFNDNFSSSVSDISLLDQNGLTQFAQAISDDINSPAELVENNGRKYLCVKDTLNDSGGVYTVTQYVTICNNKTFYFAGYNAGEDTSDEVQELFGSFKLQEKNDVPQMVSEQRSKINRQYIFINAGVVFFVGIAIATFISIIKIRRKNITLGDQQ